MMAPMEPIVEPELLIIDPHHHLIEVSDNHYMMEELLADIGSGHRIEKTVFIEVGTGYRKDGPEEFRSVGETELVVELDPKGVIAGIVAYADLRLPEVEDVYAAQKEAAAGRLRGIRQCLSWDASPEIVPPRWNPPGLCANEQFRSNFVKLSDWDLTFDAWLFHPQIPELIELARACPDVIIIVNHLGGPICVGPYREGRDEWMAAWRSNLKKLAGCPNVMMKLGGIGMPIMTLGWHDQSGGAASDQIVEVWGDDIRLCIELFGVNRCMFESNFPPDRLSYNYAVLWNAFKKVVADASSAEKAALFHDTAAQVYRI
jgi:L-fuconolactonase